MLKFTLYRIALMARKVILALALTFMVAVAGCSTIGGSPSPTAETSSPNQTTTPGGTTTPVQSSTATESSSVEYPEGITEGGVDNEKVSQNHLTALRNTSSFTISQAEVATIEADGTESVANSSHLYKVEGQKTLAKHGVGGEIERTVYMNSSTILKQNHREYSAQERQAGFPERVGSYYVTPFFASAQFEMNGSVVEGGEALIKLDITGIGNGDQLRNYYSGATIESLDGHALVTSQGLVTEMKFITVVENEQGMMTTDVTRTVSNTGSTTVSLPEWQSEAVKKLGAYGFAVQNNKSLAITPGQDGIESGSTVYLYEQDAGQNQVTLDEKVEAGQTVYLYYQNDQLRASKTAPETTDENIGYYSVSALGPNGSELFTHNGMSSNDESNNDS